MLRPRLIAELRDGASAATGATPWRVSWNRPALSPGCGRRWGLDLVAYEAGTHLVGVAAHLDDADLTALFVDVNYSQGMGDLYTMCCEGWVRGGGGLFAHFSDIRAPGRWGSFGALRHLTTTPALGCAGRVRPRTVRHEPRHLRSSSPPITRPAISASACRVLDSDPVPGHGSN